MFLNINQTFFRRYGRSGEQARNYEDILRTLRPLRRAELGVIRHIILIVFDCTTNSNRSLIKILMSDNSELARLNSFKDRKCVKNVQINV